MAFTPTNLSTVPLLETTFISDMRLIVNANTTLLRTQIEDVINNLEIDLVNSAIGVDNPLSNIFSESLVLSSQMLFKDSASSSANTIASLTQSAGVSTFNIDNLNFNKTLGSTQSGSLVATPAVVIGTTAGNVRVTVPNTGGVADKGLYVGDSVTSIPANFYGAVNFAKQATVQSSANRTITLAASGTDYTYADLVLSNTSTQFIYLTLKLPADWSQSSSKPIWLLLHEDFSTTSTRPTIGQTFTIVIDNIVDSGNNSIATTSWPTASVGTSAAGINIISGWRRQSVGSGAVKSAYVNYAEWASVPSSSTGAVSAISTTYQYARFFNPSIQSGTPVKRRGSTISFTKTEQSTDFSRYTITSSSNASIIN